MAYANGRKRHHSALERSRSFSNAAIEQRTPVATSTVEIRFVRRTEPSTANGGALSSNSSDSEQTSEVFNATAGKVNGAGEKRSGRFSCPKCPRTFEYSCRYEAHMQAHSAPRRFACTFEGCEYAFASASRLRRHSMTHNRRVRYSNSEADLSTELEPLQTGSSGLATSDELPAANNSFASAISCSFSLDARRVLPRVADLTCPVCKRVFSRTDNLKVHIRRQHNHSKQSLQLNVSDNCSISEVSQSSRVTVASSDPGSNLVRSATNGNSQSNGNGVKDSLRCPLASCEAPFNTSCALVVHMKMHLRDFSSMMLHKTATSQCVGDDGERESESERTDVAVNTDDSAVNRRTIACQTDADDASLTPPPPPTPAQAAESLCTPNLLLEAAEFSASFDREPPNKTMQYQPSFAASSSLDCTQNSTTPFVAPLDVATNTPVTSGSAFRCPCDNCPFASDSRVALKEHLSKHLTGELAGDPLLSPFLGLTESDMNEFNDALLSDMMMDPAVPSVLNDPGLLTASTQDDGASLLRALDLMRTPARHEPGPYDLDDLDSFYHYQTGVGMHSMSSYAFANGPAYYENVDTVHVSTTPISMTPNVSALTLPSVNKPFAKNVAAASKQPFFSSIRSPLVDRRVQQAVLAPPVIEDGCARTDALCNSTMCELVRRRREQLRAVTAVQSNALDRPVRIQQVQPVLVTPATNISNLSRSAGRWPRRMSVSNGSLAPPNFVSFVSRSNEPLIASQSNLGSLIASPCPKNGRSVSTSASASANSSASTSSRWRNVFNSVGAADALKMSAVVDAITDANIRLGSAAGSNVQDQAVHTNVQLSSLNLSYLSPKVGCSLQQKGVNIITLTPTNAAKRIRSNLGAPY